MKNAYITLLILFVCSISIYPQGVFGIILIYCILGVGIGVYYKK
jgi:hypothetical protein